MSVYVIITGLPSEALFPKLVFSFKGLLRKIAIRKFWIRELTESYGLEGKQMTVEFTSHAEARKARGFFNNLPFIYGNMEYQLKARMAVDGSGGGQQMGGGGGGRQMGGGGSERQMETDMGEDWGRRRPAKREQRPRSQSPGYRREASKLDLEIELLRKQRLVIEEERRLLLEQKKLEMIREYGPNATRELDNFDSFKPPRKRRHPEPVQAKRPRQRSPPLVHKPPRSRPKGLPVFFQPCKKLIADMKPYIEKGTTSEEAGILIKLIRAAIRKSLAVALDGKDYMPTGEIINLYREKHPKQSDEHFVAKILANIRASYMTDAKLDEDDAKTTKAKEENDTIGQKNDRDDITEKQTGKQNEGQGDQVTNDTVPQEKPANEENGTDAASDLGNQVKQEPVTSLEPEINTEVSNLSEKVSGEMDRDPEKVPDVAQNPEKVPGEISQEPENISDEGAQNSEKASTEISHEPKNDSGNNTQELVKVFGENGPAKAATETNDAAEFDKEFSLEDTEIATDLLTEGDLQDADDWVEEQ